MVVLALGFWCPASLLLLKKETGQTWRGNGCHGEAGLCWRGEPWCDSLWRKSQLISHREISLGLSAQGSGCRCPGLHKEPVQKQAQLIHCIFVLFPQLAWSLVARNPSHPTQQLLHTVLLQFVFLCVILFFLNTHRPFQLPQCIIQCCKNPPLPQEGI